MRRKGDPRQATQRETLVCFALLRQMETPCQALRDAYGRLIKAASRADGSDVATVLLDWLEEELRAARALGEEAGRRGAELMRAAAALASALKQ